jgi:outer membrane protein OmpA-like peptidoglycan-associated protein
MGNNQARGVIIILFFFTAHLLCAQKEGAPVNMGPTINSKNSETCPVISPDGKTFFVCRFMPDNDGFNNIWSSSLHKNGEWGSAKKWPTPFNEQGAPTAVNSMSLDGKRILLSNVYDSIQGKLIGPGCSMSEKVNGVWSYPQKLEIENFENKARTVDFFMSNNGQAIIMSIEKDGGVGLIDLWVSFKGDKQKWQSPINLGSVINTPNREFAPFLASDGRTLYFASDGHAGFGSADIWVSRRLDESWVTWSTPTNLGGVINSSNFDAFFAVDGTGRFGYYVSQMDAGFGGTDIYQIKLKDDVRPIPMAVVTGLVVDGISGKNLDAKLVYSDLLSGDSIGELSISKFDPDFTFFLPFGRAYNVTYTSEGYKPWTSKFYLVEDTEMRQMKDSVFLLPDVAENRITLENVFFQSGKSELYPSSYPELNHYVTVLKGNTSLKARIVGHTDNQGDLDVNRRLSEQRSIAVKTYLVQKGIVESRFEILGWGEVHPVKSNATSSGRADNRRVELELFE